MTEAAAPPKNFVCEINDAQRAALETYLREHAWSFAAQPYAHWRAAGDKINVVAYLSGKLTVQGANTPDFVLYYLEPELLKSFTYGYGAPDAALPAATAEAPVTPHGGIDESGKGDFFGPLVIAGVYVDAGSGAALAKAGVRDSKLIKSDREILRLAQIIRDTTAGRFALVRLDPPTYNRLYAQIGNLNRLLAWGHARVIENLLEKVPDCPRMLSDKFGSEVLIQRALMSKGRRIQLDQETKAESDVAVAAASILARAGFIDALRKLGAEAGNVTLPRGAGAAVLKLAKQLVFEHGDDGGAFLEQVAKTHFKTRYQALGLPVPEAPPWGGGYRKAGGKP